MKKIGMLVAVEINAVLKKYEGSLTRIPAKGFDIQLYKDKDYEIFILKSGAGQVAAASGTQYLISNFDVEMIINYGVVGGLTEEMGTCKTCIVEKAVHYDFDTSAIDNCEVGRYIDLPSLYLYPSAELINLATSIHPEMKSVICASGDKFVADAKQKEDLHNKFNADICEMEAAAIILTSNRNDVPCILIKTVSDSITGGADEFLERINDTADICLEIADKIIKNMVK